MKNHKEYKFSTRTISSDADECVVELIKNGIAIMSNNSEYIQGLQKLKESALAFFQDTLEYKKSHQLGNPAKGYRGACEEYSRSPERPDQNESFSYWSNTRIELKNRKLSPKFADDAENFLLISESCASAIIAALSKYYDYHMDDLKFRSHSYLQINYTPANLASEYIQDKHEDGHLLTLHNGNGKGLILYRAENRLDELESNHGSSTIIPGSTITLMTGGEIPPMYHEVKNPFDGRARISVMYFVNLDPTRRILPFVSNFYNENVDIATHVDKYPENFGLPSLKKS